ncbi:aromatic amino acid lyase [Hymenobacter polaris]|uniref:aromatic amino acid lyase n=1 Tax=Hymenobacter polaris TaxID=2682546 RepID=UPI0019D5A21E|nr:aromatic amino acid lyase [Hymenobacter polaris]
MPYLPPGPLTLGALAELLASDEPVRLAPGADWPLAPAAGPAAGPDLLLACATGLGPELPAGLVRRLLLLKAAELSQAPPGATPAAVRRLLDFFSRDVWPVVHTLGARSDQAALAHLCLPLVGLGEVNYQGYRLAAADVLGLFGWEPLPLPAPAEALALLSGQAFTLAYATEALARAEALGRAATHLAPLLPGTVPTLGALPASRQLIEATLLAPPRPAQLHANPTPTPELLSALGQLAQAVAALATDAARRLGQLVAGRPAPAAGYSWQALPQAAASLADTLPRARAASANGAAAEALRTVEIAEQLLGLELLAAAWQPAASGAAEPAALVTFRAHATFVGPGQLLAPALERAARFVREYAWA